MENLTTIKSCLRDLCITYLDYLRVGKDFIKNLQILSPWFQGVYDPILVSCADLHQTNYANVRVYIMVFEVYCYFFCLLEILEHGSDGFRGVH